MKRKDIVKHTARMLERDWGLSAGAARAFAKIGQWVDNGDGTVSFRPVGKGFIVCKPRKTSVAEESAAVVIEAVNPDGSALVTFRPRT